MKRIAIYCDGTWNRPDAVYPTNVFKLHEATRKTGLDGTTQLLKYIAGVGTGFGMNGLAKSWDRFRGGVFGAGVTRNILAGYTFLAEHYEPGDKIYIMGFSRGGFTARSLAGMVRSSGLPVHGQSHRADIALRRYRDPAKRTAPSTESSHQFRLRFSPHIATSQKEMVWRAEHGHPTPHLLDITYLGIWDTVGAMGVPGHYKFLAKIFNGSHGFHDTRLSSSVMAARHAVSIDEARRTFPPTLWGNLADLNRDDPERGRNYQQSWFPGDHGSVGGGGDIVGLSNISLRWVAQGAADQGLDFDWVGLNRLMQDEDVTVPLINKSRKEGWLKSALRRQKLNRPRVYGPLQSWELSQSARDRHAALPNYRPELF